MVSTGWFRRWLGDEGERLAARFLKRQGYRILMRQARNRFGEIDLIALDGDVLVFVEVKSRRDALRESPAERVDSAKRRTLTRAALAWLKRRGLLNRRGRFDIVTVQWTGPGDPEIRHARNAFDAVDFGQLH
ncbi:MAG: YraN family protein [Planctomyces sp.]|nr:YraN family protein [Planctomyces sp.]